MLVLGELAEGLRSGEVKAPDGFQFLAASVEPGVIKDGVLQAGGKAAAAILRATTEKQPPSHPSEKPPDPVVPFDFPDPNQVTVRLDENLWQQRKAYGAAATKG